MTFWERLQFLWNRGANDFTYNLDARLVESLQQLADMEQRPVSEMTARLLRQAVREREAMQTAWERWQTLTPREQDMTALVCLDFTTRQIAARYGISTETVKSHISSVLVKFGVRNRQHLRRALFGWDFSAWEDHAYGAWPRFEDDEN